jgi:hypothetical protein
VFTLTKNLRSKVVGLKKLTSVKIMLSAEMVLGGDTEVGYPTEVHSGKLSNLGLKVKHLSAMEEEATKDDDALIPYSETSGCATTKNPLRFWKI